jgi:hypothetical protein
MKSIFKNYTGSAFLNNALQTIEVLGGLDEVSEITTDTLLELYKEHKIWSLFKRMKSYSMLFMNQPLINFQKKEFGTFIFQELMLSIIEDEKNYEGSSICPISGLKFNKEFSFYYRTVIEKVADKIRKTRTDPKKLKNDLKNLYNTDTSISRCWFPLLGSIGSDAQALPQAKFDIQVHPICLVIIQFLPFSALLYKGGILLFDTTNFEFSKDFIEESVERVQQEINLTPSEKSVENIRDFSQGDYILKSIRIYKELRIDYDAYTDLNLWKFSNSGTGASCEIDRIPNQTFKTLLKIYDTNSKCQEDLKDILKRSSKRFLEHLIEGKDYYGLYPRRITVKKGKKTEVIKLEGVSVEFFDVYQAAINNDKYKNYAKYIAFLINEDEKLKDSEVKLLEKFDAYKEAEYNTLIYTVLLRATQNGLWSLENHLEILDETDNNIIRSWIYGIFKMVHFYYHKKGFLKDCPIAKETKLTPILSTIIHLIEEDERKKDSIDRLTHNQNYENFNINKIFIRNAKQVELGAITNYLYDDYRPRKNDLNKLLRLYYNQVNPSMGFEIDYLKHFKNANNQPFSDYQQFVETFQEYYLDKYNKDTSKYERSVLKPFTSNKFDIKKWIVDVLGNMKNYSNKEIINKSQIESFEENLFYAPNGEYSLSFSQFAIQFLLNKHFINHFQNKEIETL